MLALIQLVTHANVKIQDKIISKISRGIVAFIGIEKNDTEFQAEKLLEKIINYRIFPDTSGKMNHSLSEMNGGLLLIPQFTLVSDTTQGARPGFSKAMSPEKSSRLFDYLISHAKSRYGFIACGEFGEHMQINLCNDGPVTFILEAKNS